MITLNLLPVFCARGIDHPYRFLLEAGMEPEAARQLLQAGTRQLSLDQLEALCNLLHCSPADLFYWQQEGQYASSGIHAADRENRRQLPEYISLGNSDLLIGHAPLS